MGPTDKPDSHKRLCLGLGLTVLDHTFLVDPFPRPDEKIEARLYSSQVGGPVPTALCVLARFGAQAYLLAKIGNDHEGRAVREALRSFGVSTSGLVLATGWRTPKAVIIVEESSGKRSVILTRLESPAFSPDDINISIANDARYLLLDGREAEAAIVLARLVRGGGGEVVLDIGSERRVPDELLGCVDHLVVSERFSRAFTGEADPERAALGLSLMGFKTVVITSGSDGCLGVNSVGELFRQTAFTVEIKDTTGAGDVFHGAYVYGLIQGWELPRTLEFSSAAAALKCTRIGGTSGIPELGEVFEFRRARGAFPDPIG